MDGIPRRRLRHTLRRRAFSARRTCRSTAATRSARTCATHDDYSDNGYSRWPFFEYLAEKYGLAFVQDVFARAPPALRSDSPHQRISDALVARARRSPTRTTPGRRPTDRRLQHLGPAEPQPPVYVNWQTGPAATSARARPGQPPVDAHVEFTRGDGDASHLCYAAHAVADRRDAGRARSRSPSSGGTRPGTPPVPLTINGNTATASIPWDTCTYAGDDEASSRCRTPRTTRRRGRLLGQGDAVGRHDQRATPSAPPDPVGTATPVIQVTSADVAPTLFLFGPEILRLSSVDTRLRLIVESGSEGTVQAKLGSVVLGTALDPRRQQRRPLQAPAAHAPARCGARRLPGTFSRSRRSRRTARPSARQ